MPEQPKINKDTHFIKMYGLQRSGTNYLTHLINNNFKNTNVLVNIGGWKHGYYNLSEILGKELDVMVITKNPYAWLWSVYDYWSPPKKLNIGPDLTDVSFEQFLHSKAIFERQRGVPYLIRAENPIQYWNNLNYHWSTINMEKGKVCMITYESLLYNMHHVLIQIMKGFGLEPKSEDLDFVGCKKTFTPAGETLSPSKEEFKKENYYTQKKYMQHYTESSVQFVNEQLDKDLMRRLGYSLEEAK